MEWNKFGNAFFMADTPPEDVFKPLPAAVYTVKVMPMSGVYFLDRMFESFDLPPKFYGDVDAKSNRVISTYSERDTSTGVLFVGEKGSGKSLTAKYICNQMIAKDIPIIVINSPHNSNGFCEFIKKIDQDCVIFIDEFEKLYKTDDDGDESNAEGGSDNANSQNKLLSLFDGVFSSKKLFILTANNKYNISSFLLNRPGRVYYMFEYAGLSQAFIQEYCEDNLKNKTYINKVLGVTSLFTTFTFDMIQGLVEEMNRFDLPPEEAIDGLNINQPMYYDKMKFKMSLETLTGEEIHLANYDWYRDDGRINMVQEVDISFNDIIVYKEKPEFRKQRNHLDFTSDQLQYCSDAIKVHHAEAVSGYARSSYFDLVGCFLSTDLSEVDGRAGVYKYVNKDGLKLTLTKVDEFQSGTLKFAAY